MSNDVAYLDESTSADWSRTLYAFVAEKERRSGSLRTVQSYSRSLADFFGRARKTPDLITTQDVFAWAYGVGLSGRKPSSITIGARLAAVSSFYRFLIRMKIVASNPCDAIERPKVTESQPRGIGGDGVKHLLAIVPMTPAGQRDRAIILTLTFTARRRSEVFRLTAGDITFDNGRAYYSYRGKGGKTGRRELPAPAMEAIKTWLACSGRELTTMASDDSLWPNLRTGKAITSGTFYCNLQQYLKDAGLTRGGVHLFRHSAAKLRRDAGDSVEEVSRFLDHSSLAVTTTYLRRLEGQEDKSWEKVAAAIGL